MRADMSAEGDRFGGRAGPAGVHEFAVFLAQAVKIRRMQRIVRHAGEIGLCQVDRAASGDRAEKVGKCGQVSSLPARLIRLVERVTCLVASLFQIRIQFAAGLLGFYLRLMEGLLRIVFQLFSRLARLLAGVFLITVRASGQSKYEKKQRREFHQIRRLQIKGQTLRAKTGYDRLAHSDRDRVLQERGSQRRQLHMLAVLIPGIGGRESGGPAHDPTHDSLTPFSAAGDNHAANRPGDEAGRQAGRRRSIRHKRKLVSDQFAQGEEHKDVTVGRSRKDGRSGKRAQPAYRTDRGLTSVIHAWIVAPNLNKRGW
jgi:hypothetical protein